MAHKNGIRKIVNGRIRFFGKFFSPDDPHFPYNGDLDGQKWYFMSYDPLEETHMIAMWGDEKRYKARLDGEVTYDEDCDTRSEANIDSVGHIRWYTWKEVE